MSLLPVRANPYVLHGVHIEAHGRPKKSRNALLFKVTCDGSCSVWVGVAILYDEIIAQNTAAREIIVSRVLM